MRRAVIGHRARQAMVQIVFTQNSGVLWRIDKLGHRVLLAMMSALAERACRFGEKWHRHRTWKD